MADKTIGGLPAFDGNLSDDALLIIEQGGSALKMTGAQWKQYAISAAQNKASEVANKIAQKAKESENNAKAYAEGGTVQKTTYDESGHVTGITATEVTGAKGYQSKAAENAISSQKLMLRAKAYAEGGAVEQELIGGALYPAVDTIGAKGYMEQAQGAADRAESAAERAEAAGGSGSGGGEGTPGGYYTPTVSQPDANTMRVSYTPSQEGMPAVGQVNVVLPKGSPGSNGKTAYQYAQDGGYTGSESEFAAKLAAEHLPVPATAAVGQYFRAKTVDGNGLVTEVEAVDAPSGAGGGEGLEFIQSFKLSPDTAVYTLADTATYKRIRVNIERPAQNTSLGSGNCWVRVNNPDIAGTHVALYVATTGYTSVYRLFEAYADQDYAYSTNIGSGNNRATLTCAPGYGWFRTPGSESNTFVDTYDVEKFVYELAFAKPATCIDGEETVYVFGERR